MLKELGKTGLKISRLGLGTAEIGFAYGIGKPILPTEAEAVTLLKKAVELGITFFDTANYYGLAEERIGKSGILKNPAVIVETKCAKFLEDGAYYSKSELRRLIREQVETSLRQLQTETLSILLLHGPSKEQIESGELVDILSNLKREGKIRFAGVSTRGEASPIAAIKSEFFDVIQVAYSILDQRMKRKVLPAAKKKNIGVINRSVLLKGALTPAVSRLPPALKDLKENSARAGALAKELKISLPALALRFTLSKPTINTTLIGTNSLAHLTEAVDAIKAGPLPTDVIASLQTLAITDPNQVDPAKWPK